MVGCPSYITVLWLGAEAPQSASAFSPSRAYIADVAWGL